MEYTLETEDSQIPMAITVDTDNGIYTIRKSDTSGEVFQEARDLYQWLQDHQNNLKLSSNKHFNTILSDIRHQLDI